MNYDFLNGKILFKRGICAMCNFQLSAYHGNKLIYDCRKLKTDGCGK